MAGTEGHSMESQVQVLSSRYKFMNLPQNSMPIYFVSLYSPIFHNDHVNPTLTTLSCTCSLDTADGTTSQKNVQIVRMELPTNATTLIHPHLLYFPSVQWKL